MLDLDPKNLNFLWCTKFVRALYEQGVQRVIISPGSRSTPLTLAFATHPGIEKIINIDERSAAFMALGSSKYDGIPTCLVCTSGTAAANYFPAIIEASQTGVPLIVLTADRPPNLRGIGASQTIDQLKLFGDYPVWFHEVGEPVNSTKGLNRLETSAIQSVIKAIQNKGVSHVNFAFSKPFEPSDEILESIKVENEKHARRKFKNKGNAVQSSQLSNNDWSRISECSNPLIIAGAEIPKKLGDSIQLIARQLNAPILCEPASNIESSKYTVTGFDGFLRNKEIVDELKPDIILRFGKEPVSKAVTQFLSTYNSVPQLRFNTSSNIEDETQTASKHILINSGLILPEFESNSDKEWIRAWRRYQKYYFSAKERLMFPTSPLTDGYVFHILSELIPSKSFTMLSNSFPVRDMALFGEYDGKEMFVNRGAAGIDGILSTTIGLSKASNKPGILFIGDIAFLHDSNALLQLQDLQSTLIIVILNNGGGSIFKMLPINTHKQEFSDYFETPQNVSIAALCRAHKIDHTLISRSEQLIPTFESHIERPGAHIFECITDAEDSMHIRNALWNFTPDLE